MLVNFGVVARREARVDSSVTGVGVELSSELARWLGPGVLLLEVTGEIDSLTVGALAAAICDAVTQKPTHLVLELSGVTFLGSSGIQAFLDAQHGDGEVLHRLHLVVDPEARIVHRPLQITGVLDLLQNHASVEAFQHWLDTAQLDTERP